jgi:hypothetical protein
MTPTSTKEKVELIVREHKQGLGSLKDLCRKHSCAISNFYRVKKLYVDAPVLKTMKRKYNPKPKVIDIPIQAKPEFVIICRAEDAAKVMGTL